MSMWAHAFADLAGRKALVTGGSTGIGAAVAKALGECGVDVALHYNSSEENAREVCREIESRGARSLALKADLARAAGAEGLVEQAVAQLGHLDLLINNAGSILGRVPTLEIEPDFYQSTIELNLTAVFLTCQAALRHFRLRGGGTIINTTSLAARMGGGPGTVTYATAKAGVSTLTRGLAKEFAGENIRVNAIAPGFIRTPLHERHTSSDVMDAFERSVPMQRLGEPDDCVGAYLFLASERLSGYITGQIIEVNGGVLMP